MQTVRSVVRMGVAAALSAGLVAAATGAASGSVSSVGHDASARLLFGRHALTGVKTVPPGFSDTVTISGLSEPSVIQFAADGRVYVGEKGGFILEFDSPTDPTPTQVANLSTNVYDWSDRGLLGMALDPNFTTGNPYLYVLYTLDAQIGGTPPVYNDDCTDPTGSCPAGARVSRMRIRSNGKAGPEQVLIEGWCQQFPSHSIGTLAFGPEGALYVGGGDGASFNDVDYGQFGNPCGDPTNEGGALRAQDDRTRLDPTGLNGAILRVDPATGDAWPGNPLIGGDPSDDRIIAYGLRNPFRFALKPGGTDRVYVGDVGWYTWEEIDRIISAGDAKVEDFGWPCYEGKLAEPDYQAANLPICNDLYAHPNAATKPASAMNHAPGGCSGSNVFSALGFYPGGTYPAGYAGAMFFADVVRGCMWTMFADPNGDPIPSTRAVFATGVQAVDLKPGSGGDMFYVDIYGGTIRRISYAVDP